MLICNSYFTLIGDVSVFVCKNGRVTVLCIHSRCIGHPSVCEKFYFYVTMCQVYCWKAMWPLPPPRSP
jgi:hypothetical protein